MSVICMNFFMLKWGVWISCIVVIESSINSHHVYVLVLLDWKSFIDIFVSSEIRRFIHIQPDSRKINTFLKTGELTFPISSSIWMQKINKMNYSRPYLPSINISILFKKNIQLFSTIHCNPIIDRYSNINQWNKMNTFVFQ